MIVSLIKIKMYSYKNLKYLPKKAISLKLNNLIKSFNKIAKENEKIIKSIIKQLILI